MPPIEWTDADIAQLKAQILSSGFVKRIRFRGPPEREMEFRDLREMQDLLAQMQATHTTRYRRARFSKGFRP